MPDGVCVHGFQVTIKSKTLKRRTTIVKHSRFLRNMQVFPIFPPEPVPVQNDLEEGAEQAEEDE
jgi:hypothetical protein